MMSESSWLISAWKAKVSVSEAMAPELLPGTRSLDLGEGGEARVRVLERLCEMGEVVGAGRGIYSGETGSGTFYRVREEGDDGRLGSC
jgi:hypothetical protein